jgi:hypothetical protein
MASDTYFAAQTAARVARQANALAAEAHSMLTRIQVIRTELRSATGTRADTLTRSWHGLVDARNLTIREWQTATGRQWETYGENLTRV